MVDQRFSMETLKDIIGMAVVGVLMSIAVPFVFVMACLWQLWGIACEA